MQKLKIFLVGALAASLLACGGGGGDPGTPTGAAATPPPVVVATPDEKVASFVYQLDKNTLSNSGGDKVTLTVTTLDASNNPVEGATVLVSVDSGVFTPTTTLTDAKGEMTGTIAIGGNKSNRQITAKVTAGGKTTSKTSTVVIPVVGSKIVLTPVPATVAPGGSVTVNVRATDTNDSPISNVPVKLAGTLGFNQTVTTDAAGNATATLAVAPGMPGTYTVTASGLGVDSTRDVQVVSLSGGGIPAAVGVISAANLNISPNTIAPNVAGATTNIAHLRAVFQDAQNQAVKNVRVRFVIAAPGLGSGEKISTGNAIVYSDSTGVATADYIAGTRSSPTDGVLIVACYGMDDAALAGAAAPGQPCPPGARQAVATLTVGAQPLNVTIGTDNKLERGNDGLTYIKKFDIAVADAAGNAVPNALISASVDLVKYYKGQYAPKSEDEPTINVGRAEPPCDNEDINRNGFLDVGEDYNGNGFLDPRKADVILSFGASNVTNASGRMAIQAEYAQSVATWLVYAVKVTTNVAGSEGTVTREFTTTFIAGDEKPSPAFLYSPYGSAKDCKNPR